MRTSEAGKNFIKVWEGCRLTAYKDADGYSIGYGHYGAVKGQKITQKCADCMFEQDLEKYEAAVNMYKSYNWNQNEFDALVDFAYNCGVGSLKILLHDGSADRDSIRKRLLLYNRSNGKVLQGLVDRRGAELTLFNMG